jgi:DNA-binding PadR family transcriptional regulator
MTGDAFGQQWGGTRGSGRHRRRYGPPGWSRPGEGYGGRPPIEDIDELIALGRMWRRGQFGGHGSGPSRRGRGRGRRGDVRLALLRLLAEEPRNGYQLIQTVEERSEGLWRPSPGSVYPTLAQLEDEGLIRSVETDGNRRFEITDAGREHLDGRTQEPAPWEPAEETAENPLAELVPLVIQIGKATFQVAAVGDRATRDQARAVLADTRRSLYRLLADEQAEAEADEDVPGGVR